MPSPVTAETTWAGTPKVTAAELRDGRLELSAQVGLGQDDDGLGAALPGEREVALEPARVEVVDERVTTKTMSTFAATTCSTDSKPAALRTNAVRRGSTASTVARAALGVAGERDPVADRGQIGAGGGPVAQPAGHVGPDLLARRCAGQARRGARP